MAAQAGGVLRAPRADAPYGLRVEEIAETDALEALAPQWGELFAADPQASPFQSPDWLLAWRRAFLTAGGLWTLAVRRDGGLVGLAPFFIYADRPSGRRQLTLLGNGLSDRQGLLARPEARAAVAQAVARRLAERRSCWDTADFRDLPEGSPLLDLPLPCRVERIEPEAPCPVLELPADPAAVLARLPRSRRTDLRRCARRLSEIAPLGFTRADPASLGEHLEAIVRLHGARREARGEPGKLADAAVVAFHAEAAAGLMRRGLLRLEALRLGGRIIAAHYGLRLGERGYSYLHAFDPEFAAFGPGWLMLASSLEAAARDGVRRFDFLRGREPYKYAWGAVDERQWRRRTWALELRQGAKG
jgi:CelD/BcsL family acetyltransferase involved in cellulose biosynthesis